MSIECPIECAKMGCPDPDWLEKHNAFLLTIVGGLGAGLGVLLSYFLKSRCSHIKMCCIDCDREVVNLQPADTEVTSTTSV